MRQSSMVIGALFMSATAASTAVAEDLRIKGTIADVFGHRIVMQSETEKYLVNLGPKIGEMGVLKSGDSLSVEGERKRSGEVRAYTVTLSDGRAIKVGGDKQTWRQWLLGDDKKDKLAFTADNAKTLATQKGYVVNDTPMPVKRHFVVLASKDGKVEQLTVHRDGRIETQTPFRVADAKQLMTDKGYDVIGDPSPMKSHFEGLARKDSVYYELHAHRDGRVNEARKVEKSDPRWGAQIP